MQTFEVRAWDDAGVHVVEVSGEFDMAAGDSFREASARDDAKFVVVDLRRVSFLDSSGLRELIDLHRQTELRGTRLAIIRPRGDADSIFRLTGIDGHLPLYDEKVPVLAEFNFG
jgi:anti-sigma B factor antagonist